MGMFQRIIIFSLENIIKHSLLEVTKTWAIYILLHVLAWPLCLKCVPLSMSPCVWYLRFIWGSNQGGQLILIYEIIMGLMDGGGWY